MGGEGCVDSDQVDVARRSAGCYVCEVRGKVLPTKTPPAFLWGNVSTTTRAGLSDIYRDFVYDCAESG